jgi:deferrochelatase/peroxidase EfeB
MLKRKDLSQTAINLNLPKFRALLENVQGNILRPRMRTHAALVFFTVKPERSADAKARIRRFAAKRVTSARSQISDDASRKPFCSLLLSAAGYGALDRALRPPPT